MELQHLDQRKSRDTVLGPVSTMLSAEIKTSLRPCLHYAISAEIKDAQLNACDCIKYDIHEALNKCTHANKTPYRYSGSVHFCEFMRADLRNGFHTCSSPAHHYTILCAFNNGRTLIGYRDRQRERTMPEASCISCINRVKRHLATADAASVNSILLATVFATHPDLRWRQTRVVTHGEHSARRHDNAMATRHSVAQLSR
jgi:hypothetical protein